MTLARTVFSLYCVSQRWSRHKQTGQVTDGCETRWLEEKCDEPEGRLKTEARQVSQAVVS